MTDLAQADLPPATVICTSRSWRNLALAAAAAVLFLISSSRVFAQDEGTVVRVDTDLAVLEVTVTDKNGKPVRDLTAADLRIFEDGSERPIEFFQPIRSSGVRRPLTIVFALDVSGSMTPEELLKLKSAMQTFIDRLADYNSYFAVIAFAMNVKILQQFTNRPDKLQNAFEKLGRDRDGLSTHAYDAVDTALRLLRKDSPKVIRERFPKRAVVLISDGFPVGDVVGPDTVIERANDAETSVYGVILPSYSNVLGNKKPVITPLEVSGLIEKTGGKSFYATAKNFEMLFADLAEEITGSYAVAFYPAEKTGGPPRRVRIEAKKGYLVRQNRDTVDVK
ncbi:MAG: VWA domain-containing protein [Pyrinomonadaceae bacterium]